MYKFIELPEQRKVICISSYAGRSVKGVAKCAPNDEFSMEYGKRLAQARCDVKIASKRIEATADKYVKTAMEINRLAKEAEKYRTFYEKNDNDYSAAVENLDAIVNESK